MKKQEIDFKIPYEFDWLYGVEISELKSDIEKLEKLGATHVEIEHGVYYDSSFITINAICRRIETDEEFKQRKKEIEEIKEKNRQIELNQFEILKRKYGKL